MTYRLDISLRLKTLAVLGAIVLPGCATLSEKLGGSTTAATSEGAHAVAAQRSLEYLPDAETLDWTDPETGQSSRVTVLSTVHEEDGRFCRSLAYQPDPVAEPRIRAYCRDDATGLWTATD